MDPIVAVRTQQTVSAGAVAGEDRSATTAAIAVFIAITYLFSFSLSLIVGLTGGHQSPLIGLGYLTMFFPTAAVIIVARAMNESVQVDWRRFSLRYVPFALLLMPAVMHATMLPLTAALEGGLHWQDWLTARGDGLYHSPAARGWGALTGGGLAARIALNAAVGLITASSLAFYEEIGWRGWLLPRLADGIGVRRAVIVAAIVSGLWHTPFAVSGIHHIEGLSTLKTVLTLPAGLVGAGLVLGWLWIRTRSIWIVALAHGALNNWGQYAFKYMRDFVRGDPALVLLVGGVAVLATGIALVAFGLRADRWKPRSAARE